MGPGTTLFKEILWSQNKSEGENFSIIIQGDISPENTAIEAKTLAPLADVVKFRNPDQDRDF